ncbi:EGF-like repeat and discoidin I-like domain-containing protein 3 [Dendronephthya gigantea]|uniref:EGF-like repeat and discoidin I-like domain-containing protein 3 n=1 Tax=Dendronephthya gigantea TaxID=151771 RepID=UPI00106927B0|nr:EGF-like repeat and discoidin I-like domain-containing protein 3 [Dendronephthya gigantea]
MIWVPDKQYFCQCLECYEGRLCEKVTRRALGMENGQIRDNQITASSEYDSWHRVANGRLNFTPRISTQGRNGGNQFVKSYNVSSSQDGKIFQVYTTGETVKEFQGNSDVDSIVHHQVFPLISARFIRLHPTAWKNWISMRVEFYGCYIAK